MVLKKLQFHLYNLLLIVFILLQSSCEKKNQNIIANKKDITEIDKLLSVAHNFYENQQFDSSYYYYNKAKNTAEIQQDTSRIIHSLSWLAQIQRNQGDYTGSESTSIEALPYIGNKGKFPCGETNVFIGLGNNYLNTKEYDNSIYFFKKAINSKTDELIKAGIMNNISLAYTEKGDYDKAIQILESLISTKGLINDPETYARINDNLGQTYDKAKSTKAIYYLNEGLQIRNQIKDNWGIISSNYNISRYYKIKNPSLSSKYALIVYKESTKLKSVDSRLESLRLLIQNSTGNNYKKYALLYLQINDSITKVRQKAKNNFAKIKYDSKKEKDENLKLKEQKVNDILKLQVQKSKTQALYFVILMILILTGLIYFYLKSKNRREKIQAAYTTEIKIAKKLHDELANDLYQMITFAETQDLSTENNKETLLHNLDTIYLRTRNISKENSYIDTGINFIPTLKEMITDFNTDIANVLLSGLDSINWISIENTKKITVYRVLQELLVNMKKHSNCNLVVISFKLNNNTIDLNYSDNGIGVKDQKINKKNGLENIEKRIEDIEGTIDYNSKSSRGFTVNIKFPV
ncbi:ATP-binding protein [Flavobacterium sp. WC2409]|uniref:histidine kinase n=1 Tax=Flavobacterium sp. WC2409 TaxID=3234139 RepID=A0AB39W4K6_9FLAO